MNAQSTAERIDIPAMPPNVAAAISKVMAGVPKLARGEKNTHGNYNFASIDDFLEAVRPLCAESGLIILQDESSSEMIDGVDKYGKPKRWLSVTYQFTLAHSSGETWAHRPSRSIIVDASMGSQAYGAAQSYTLKLFERSLFQIATGEKGQDVDEHASADLPRNGRKSAARRQGGWGSSTAAKEDNDWDKLTHELSEVESPIGLRRLRTEYEDLIFPKWNKDWREQGAEAFDKREAELTAADPKQAFEESVEVERGTADVAAAKLRDNLIERIQKARDEDGLIHLRDDDEGYKGAFNMLPKPMQLAVRKAGAMKMEALRKATMSPLEAG